MRRPSTWVPLASIVGTTDLPPGAAHILRQAVTRIADDNDIPPDSRWRCLEYLAAEYLAGP